MNLVDYEKYYHSGSEFIIPRDEFEKIIEENQRLKEEYIMLQNSSDKYEDKLLKENQELKDLLIEKDNQIEEIKQQKTDYTKVNILEMENQRLYNVLNELEKLTISICENCYEDRETERIKKRINKLKESDNHGN